MEPKRVQQHTIGYLCVITLFFLFVLSAVLVIMLGANIYANAVKSSALHSDERTIVSYISQKVRRTGEQGAVSTGSLDGLQSLDLSETIDGTEYVTRLYLYDGELTELTSEKGADLSPDAGTPVLAMKDLSFTMLSPSLLEVRGTGSQGENIDFCLSVLPASAAAEGGAQ
ncbi:MAG: DUF4860 domain-containing protein [Lachnospiraceae bacterium]|jgi:hypothetical protein|nr:DUF4860 domain-containing protein [Lachnospiraceae bacterium]